jgi:hypothetical protein
MLFDLFEKQLHLPVLLVDFGDGQGGKCEVVGQKLRVSLGLSRPAAENQLMSFRSS